MTIRNYIEQRKGKTLSKKNLGHLQQAAAHLKAIADNAGEPIVPAGVLGGETGDLGNPDQAAGQVSGQDATGVRSLPNVRITGAPAGPTMRTLNGQTVEVR